MKKLLLSLVAIFAAISVNAIEIKTNATSGNWTGDKDGYTATIDGYKISYLKTSESSDCVAPSDDHIRVYKNANLIIEAVNGSAITSLEFTCTTGSYAYDIVVEGGNDAKKDGAKITWTGNTTKFEGVTSNGQCRIKSIKINEGVTEPEPVVLAGKGEGTVASPYDVERALSVIANDVVTSDKVYVAGKITQIEEMSTQYGNATYLIGQGELTLKVYRGKGLNGQAFTTGDEIKVGDEVVVYGQLVTSYGGQITTGSSIYSINGKTYEEPVTPPYTAVGDGTKENPYTVDDVIGLNIQESDGNKYWVKGVILGSAASAAKLNEAEKAVDTNLALGASAVASYFIPVALPAGAVRDALGVASHPGNVNKEVMVYGTLEKYFSTAGVKNVTEAVLDGVTTGISEVKANAGVQKFMENGEIIIVRNGVRFNVAGVRR